jgi:FkbM family methyltransferase
MTSLVERLRRIGAHPWLEPAVALVLRGLTVRQALRFVLREALRRPGRRAYRLRRNGLTVLIRHRTPDVVTLGEVFHRPDYAFPPEVDALLGPRGRELAVVDLGANIGLFGLWVLGERPAARILAFEPDPANAAVLRAVVDRNGFTGRWEVEEAAAGASDGVVPFEPGLFSLSRVAEGGAGRVPMVDVLPRLPGTDLVKMDIEGGEWAILSDPRFPSAAPSAMVLEYHPHLAPPGEAPRTAIERRLRDCGYRLHEIVHRPDGHGMLWACRT